MGEGPTYVHLAATGVADRQPDFPWVDGGKCTPSSVISFHMLCVPEKSSASQAEDLAISRKAWRGADLETPRDLRPGREEGGSGPSNLARAVGSHRHRRVGLHAFLQTASRPAGSARREPRFPPLGQEREIEREGGRRRGPLLDEVERLERRPHLHLLPWDGC
ncbi:hypothetical protein LY76DRAFT_164060 [Colletotrichum caudatum]|nr:hypothetical protein LY76DRAFT_164060 [Colletotrichum caudatum]